ncbi:MAG: hypothetical protein ACI8Y4_000911 [Candidatus Poriferisodalaceae bacterium]|jgi:hypothetical protein
MGVCEVNIVAIVFGVVLVLSVFADVVNTLVATHTSQHRLWFTRQLYRKSWRLTRALGLRISDPGRQHRFLASYAPVSVLLLLSGWILQQLAGFALIWWGVGGVRGVDGLWDSFYFSGVVYFTVGFGELVPVEVVPRIGAIIEALAGVLTIALVIGYLPALYAAYSERERKLMTLDDGTEDRINPTNLICARAPDANPRDLDGWFESWEEWIAGMLETHTTFNMLVFFRSKQQGQSWVTALGLVTDAALQCEMMPYACGRAPYWMLRRSVRLFDELTDGFDLSEYERRYEEQVADIMASEAGDSPSQFQLLYQQLEDHGFELLPIEEARANTLELRRRYVPALEWLIDELVAPRGFWGHRIGHFRLPTTRRPAI